MRFDPSLGFFFLIKSSLARRVPEPILKGG